MSIPLVINLQLWGCGYINIVLAYSQVEGCGLVITRGGPQIVTSSIVQQLEGGENEAVTMCNKDKNSHLNCFLVSSYSKFALQFARPSCVRERQHSGEGCSHHCPLGMDCYHSGYAGGGSHNWRDMEEI